MANILRFLVNAIWYIFVKPFTFEKFYFITFIIISLFCIFISSFTQTSSNLYDVNLIHKFSDWAYEANWYSAPRKRFPYLGDPSKGQALLTTARNVDYWSFGTIVANQSDWYVPARWMNSYMRSPGVVWYWINENDCNADYQKGWFCFVSFLTL